MPKAPLTERQRYWRHHVLAAANNLKSKDLYQWKTATTKRGFLPMDDAEQSASDFAEVKITSVTPLTPSSSEDTAVHRRLTLPCGSVLEYINPIDPDISTQLRPGQRL